MTRVVVLVAVGTLLTPVLAVTHHSFPARYEGKKPVMLSIEGDVESFDYRNPHSILYVIVPDATKQLRRWRVEWASASLFAKMGISPKSLQPGQYVIVHGYAAKDSAEHPILLDRIERLSDGWKWSFRK